MSRRPTWRWPRAGLLLLVLCSACAWTNRANRPVWNAFEETFVPEDETMVWVSAPLTVPFGLVAILIDMFLVHPVQVMDDAWDDTTDLWADIDWQQEYYSQTAFSLLRGPASAITLVGSFLARSMFDLDEDLSEVGAEPLPPSDADREEREAWRAERQARDSTALLDWLRRLRVDPESEGPPTLVVEVREVWGTEHEQALTRVLAEAEPVARLRARRLVFAWGVPRHMDDLVAIWSDADPRVRLALLEDRGLRGRARTRAPASVALRDAMFNDPDPIIRRLALEDFGNHRREDQP